MRDQDVTTQWRQLFQGRKVSAQTLTKAEALLKRLGGESPLRLRLAQELDELRKLRHTK